MTELNNLTDMVEKILVTRPETRDSDNTLYAETLQRYAKVYGFSLDRVDEFFRKNFTEQGIPSFESVTRIRRLVQGKHPELRATDTTKRRRSRREDKFLELALTKR